MIFGYLKTWQFKLKRATQFKIISTHPLAVTFWKTIPSTLFVTYSICSQINTLPDIYTHMLMFWVDFLLVRQILNSFAMYIILFSCLFSQVSKSIVFLSFPEEFMRSTEGAPTRECQLFLSCRRATPASSMNSINYFMGVSI